MNSAKPSKAGLGIHRYASATRIAPLMARAGCFGPGGTTVPNDCHDYRDGREDRQGNQRVVAIESGTRRGHHGGVAGVIRQAPADDVRLAVSSSTGGASTAAGSWICIDSSRSAGSA